MKILYMPRPVNDFLEEEALRLERDKRIVQSYRRIEAERRAYKLHSFTLPWAITLLGIAAAGLCYLARAVGWVK